jgi:hypothetical protein
VFETFSLSLLLPPALSFGLGVCFLDRAPCSCLSDFNQFVIARGEIERVASNLSVITAAQIWCVNFFETRCCAQFEPVLWLLSLSERRVAHAVVTLNLIVIAPRCVKHLLVSPICVQRNASGGRRHTESVAVAKKREAAVIRCERKKRKPFLHSLVTSRPEQERRYLWERT